MELVAKRYAKAFFDQSLSQKKEEDAFKDILRIRKLVHTSEDLQSFLNNPIIPTEKKQKIINDIFKGKVTAHVLTFILFLETKNRLDQLGHICQAFESLYYESKNIVKVKITSTIPLTAQQLSAAKQHLKLKLRKDIETELAVDPSLIGGIKIQINDTIQDFSLLNQLEAFKQQVIHI